MSFHELQPKRLEPDIKAIVLEYMRAKNLISDSDVVINEFTIDGYSRRADLVIVRKNDTIAIEVKSQFDSLHRLKGQTEKYTVFFDKVIVVTTGNHLSKAVSQTASEVEIWELNDSMIKVIRRGKKNLVKNKLTLLRMMKVRELSVVATKNGFSENSRTRSNLEKFLLNKSINTLRGALIGCLRKRYALTSNYFWQNIQNSSISTKSLQNLSFASFTKKSITETTPSDWLSNISNAIQNLSKAKHLVE